MTGIKSSKVAGLTENYPMISLHCVRLRIAVKPVFHAVTPNFFFLQRGEFNPIISKAIPGGDDRFSKSGALLYSLFLLQERLISSVLLTDGACRRERVIIQVILRVKL